MDSPRHLRHIIGSSSSPVPSLDHTHHTHYSLLHPMSQLAFGDEDSAPTFHEANSSFCGQFDSVGRFVGHIPDAEDHSLDIDLDPEVGSADSSSYDMNHQAVFAPHAAHLFHHSHPHPHHQQQHYHHQHSNQSLHFVSPAATHYQQHATYLADQWLQHDEEPTVSSPGSDAHEWDSAPAPQDQFQPHEQHRHQQHAQQQPVLVPSSASAPTRPSGKRSASDAGLSAQHEYNPKRIKVENSAQTVQPAVLDTSNLVAAYQQLLLMQLQQVQALMGTAPVPSTAPHSPSGVSSSTSSAPPSPIKLEPISPAHQNSSSPSTPVEATRDPTYHVPHRERRVRPKVVPEKGGVQCQGFNRKKNVRCRNAALMEFMGPRPSYCAEHIHLDPECLYTKCRSTYHTSPEDGKGCREVVLKEFGFCHKHFEQFTAPLSGAAGLATTHDCLQRVEDCLSRLTIEAQSAKKVDPDLFQRKHKLIPKFVQMKNCLTRHVHLLSAAVQPQVEAPSVVTQYVPVTYYQPTSTTY